MTEGVTNHEQSSPDLELTKSEIRSRLQAVNTLYPDDHPLKQFWLTQLDDNIDHALLLSAKKKRRHAFVLQFADASINSPKDAELASAFMESLGVHAVIDGQRTDADATSISELANTQLPEIELQEDQILAEVLDFLPEGASKITDKGFTRAIALPTDIPGVKVIFDGSAVSYPEGGIRQLRPMLSVCVGEKPLSYKGELEVVDPRKTWNEIHHREPSGAPNVTVQRKAREILDDENADSLDISVASASLAWTPIPLSGEQILITPTILKQNPALTSDQSRSEAVEEAFHIARKHLVDSQNGDAESVVGATAYSLSIMADILGMSSDEIEKDGEALADLVEYLLQLSRQNPNILAPSHLLPPATEGDTISELAGKIKETWELPERGLTPFMYDRVTWKG